MIAEKQALSLCLALLALVAAIPAHHVAAEDRISATRQQTPPNKLDAEADPPSNQSDYYELLDSFVDTLDQIDRNYVKDVDRKHLVEAAIRGMLLELDPYSNYIPSDRFDQFRTGVEGEFGGVGIQAAIENGVLKVISPFVGTPAYHAGMAADDIILEIDGQSTKGIALDQAIRWMKGAIGTDVVLRVQHVDAQEPVDITLKREKIRVRTVFGNRRNPDDSWRWMYDDQQKIGYLRVTGFSRHTAAEMRAALEILTEQDMRGLILDLRFNPGGLLSAAIEVSDLFVHDGRIVSTEGRNVESRSWDAQQEGTFQDFPMVVLVNRFSASASEIVAACLQDHQRAAIVGMRTWGKGNVQNVIELSDGVSALKLTTANYHRPNGEEIHRFPNSKDSDQWGVTPKEAYQVELTRKQRAALMARHRKQDILLPKNNAACENEEAEFIDPQLQKALDYLNDCLTAEIVSSEPGEDVPSD